MGDTPATEGGRARDRRDRARPRGRGGARAASARTSSTASTCCRCSCPPLRERREDIPLLVEHFIDTLNAGAAAASRVTSCSGEALELLELPLAGQRARAREHDRAGDGAGGRRSRSTSRAFSGPACHPAPPKEDRGSRSSAGAGARGELIRRALAADQGQPHAGRQSCSRSATARCSTRSRSTASGDARPILRRREPDGFAAQDTSSEP